MKKIINVQDNKVRLSEDALYLDREPGERREIIVPDNVNCAYLLIVQVETLEVNRYFFYLGEHASLDLRYLFLGEGKQSWHLEHEVGNRAKMLVKSLAIGQKKTELSVRADYNFRGQGSFGRIAAKAVFSEHSRLRYDANINVLPSAQQSDTRVDLHLRLAGEAHGEMTPALNIAANDVKAGHSASTFQLSSEDQFYLRSRGLSPAEISRMFIMSMANNFVQGLGNNILEQELLTLITGKI